ncbi:MAG TPA: DUF2892 domain-containing protein [Gammaproteobacteria bacterium]|nr:DUF2892 domain-containing protein [Gammaproteobacteria bacterium]
MSNRLYRMMFGIALLLGLYFDALPVLYALIALAGFEAVTNLRIPRVVSKLRYGNTGDPCEGSLGIPFHARTAFEAERGWRLTVAAMLALGVFAYPEALWFVPWFMGFAILGAGISGVCPMFLAMKWAGLK